MFCTRWVSCASSVALLCFQPDTFADFEVMTDRLVDEILYHIELYGMTPSRIRCARAVTSRWRFTRKHVALPNTCRGPCGCVHAMTSFTAHLPLVCEISGVEKLPAASRNDTFLVALFQNTCLDLSDNWKAMSLASVSLVTRWGTSSFGRRCLVPRWRRCCRVCTRFCRCRGRISGRSTTHPGSSTWVRHRHSHTHTHTHTHTRARARGG